MAVLSTVLLAVCALSAIYTTTSKTVASHQRQLHVQQLCNRIERLDEVLTMSTWVAVTTGDDRWQKRYDEHVSLLDDAIEALRRESPKLFDEELGVATDEANKRLVEAEAKIFEMIAAGDLREARSILEGPFYLADKDAYAVGNQVTQRSLRSMVAREASELEVFGARLLIATMAFALLVAAAWFCVLRESHRMRSNAQLDVVRAQQRVAESSSQAKSALVANISHELRTPLTSILGYAELLGDSDYPAAEREAAVGTIDRHGRHLLQVINDLLDMSKIEAGCLEISACATDPALLVDDVLSLLRVRAQEKDVHLERTFATGLPRSIGTDPVRVRQILVNLIGNAIKFTLEGEVRVTVWYERSDDSQTMSIAVRDTGIGMTEAQVSRLFRPFEQGDSTTERRFGGTGLGLSIARHYARMLDGEIEVESTMGQGSTFTLVLPLTSDEDPTVWHPDGAKMELLPSTTQGGDSAAPLADLAGLRILLAEDGADNQRLLSYLLRRAGAEVSVADNGRIAVDHVLAAGDAVDVIFMDMQMPELDGYQATKELRAGGYTGPIVALTANAMSTDRNRCLAAGCNDYMTKPVDRRALLGTCARWASRSTV